MNAPFQPSRRPWVLVLAGALLAATTIAVADPPAALRAVLQRPAAETGTIVVPDRFLRPWDPVTVFFDKDRGPVGGGPEDHPEKLVTATPSWPGAWTWLDARTLQFRPAEPWAPLTRTSWRVDGKTVDLATLMSPPRAITPADGATGLGPQQTIEIVFLAPLPIAALEQMVTIELRPLPGVGSAATRTLGADDFEIKELGRTSASDPATYAITLNAPIPLGTRARIVFGLSLDESAESIASYSFSTAEPFRATALGCGSKSLAITPEGTRYADDQPLECSSSNPVVTVDFTAPLADPGPVVARDLVRFDPAVPGLTVSTDGKRLQVTGAFDRERLYRVALAPAAVRDTSGRPLEISGESAVYVWFPRRPSYLRWGGGEGIAELSGPKKLPMEGRGHDRVDVRIHRIDPLDRDLWPFPSTPILLDETLAPPGPGEEPGAWEASYNAPPNEVARRITALGTPGISALLDLPLRADGGAATFGLDVGPSIDRLAGAGVAGHYLVGMRKLDDPTTRTWVRLQVTDLSLTTLESADSVRFEVRSLSTGRGVPGAEIRLDGSNGDTWTNLLSLRTGVDGSVEWKPTGSEDKTVRRVSVQSGADVLVIDPNSGPDEFVDGRWAPIASTWLGWAFDIEPYHGDRSAELGHLFSERPIYRPEEPVFFKGYLRTRLHGHLEPLAPKGSVVVYGPGGEEWGLPVEVTALGSFDAKWDEPEIPTGTYRAAFLAEDTRSPRTLATMEFQVEAYRLPTFEVDLHTEATVGSDAPFDVRLTAEYYAGGRVAERPVRWRVSQYPYTWTPTAPDAATAKAREGFLWSSDGRYSRSSRFESTPGMTRDATTDETGEAILQLDPSIEPTAQPRTYTIEATVTGADDQTVTTTARVNAVPAFVLGMKAPRFIEHAKTIPVQVLVAGPTGAAIAGQDVTVRLLHREWHSHLQASDFTEGTARYVTDVVDTPVSTTTVSSAATATAVDLPIEVAGVYVVEIESRDRLGRAQVVSVDLYAGGEAPVAWEKPKAGVFTLTGDAETYRPGQTATIVVQSPYQTAEGTVVIEAPDKNVYQAVKVKGGAAVIKVPIDGAYTPRIPIHVILSRGRTPGVATGGTEDLGRPASVASTLWLTVEPTANQVAITLDHPPKALPGETIDVKIKLADPDGKPLAGEVTLWLVDQAILGLAREQRLDPLPDFITPRRSYARLVDTRNLTLGSLPLNEMPGGDGEEELEDALDSVTVRKNFKPVPYWNPSIDVGPTGIATVKVPLPDNLTRFAVRAKAVSGKERLGHAKSEVAVRLPVVLQAALPRFVRPGDTFDATAIARVVEGAGGAGVVSAEVKGLTLTGDSKAAMTWDDVRAASLAFPVTVPTPKIDSDGRLERTTVSVKMGARRTSDGAGDGFEVVLPLRDDRVPVVVRQLAELDAGVPFEVAALPEAARPGSVRRSVVVADDAALVKMAAGLDFFRLRPVGNTEQRIARARTWLALWRFRASLGMFEGKDEMDAAVVDTMEWIDGALDGHDTVAMWPGRDGSITLTAYAASFLVEARDAGYPVDARLLTALTEALKKGLRSDYPYFVTGEIWYERAMALEALAQAGKLDSAYYSELGRNGSYLGYDGRSRVVLAATRGGEAKNPVTTTLVADLTAGITTRLYDGGEVYSGLLKARTDRNPLILPSEARTLALMSRSMARTVPTEPKLALVYDALVQLGKEDGWGSTNTNSEALLALAEWLDRKVVTPSTVEMSQDGAVDVLKLGPGDPAAARTSASGSAVKVTLKSGIEHGVLLATTRYVPKADGSTVDPAATGFVVTRELLVQTGSAPERHALEKGGSTVALTVGDVVEEHVQIVNPEQRYYVAVLVPLAAGMEPLNPRLATAPPEAKPSAPPTLEPSYVAYYDDQVGYYYESLPKGTYDFRFRTRASTPGTFIQPAATAEQQYDLATRGNSAGAKITITRKSE